jgi:hypothetical protein
MRHTIKYISKSSEIIGSINITIESEYAIIELLSGFLKPRYKKISRYPGLIESITNHILLIARWNMLCDEFRWDDDWFEWRIEQIIDSYSWEIREFADNKHDPIKKLTPSWDAKPYNLDDIGIEDKTFDQKLMEFVNIINSVL